MVDVLHVPETGGIAGSLQSISRAFKDVGQAVAFTLIAKFRINSDPDRLSFRIIHRQVVKNRFLYGFEVM